MECFGEMIDGYWETGGCQCEDCLQLKYERAITREEMGPEA